MTSTPSSYHAHAVLTPGGLWQADVDELPEVRESHRSLSQLQTRVRKAVAKAEGLDIEAVTLAVLTVDPARTTQSGSITLDMTISTGDEAFDTELTAARELRREAERLARQARLAAAPLAKRLVSAGVSHRDAGTLLSVSGALVSELIKP
ncbi:hypothetical protein [Streptomyces sp. NPDC001205]